MLLERVFLFLKGYLLIHMQGIKIDQFINLCVQENITIWDIGTVCGKIVIGKINIKDFKRLRPIVRASRVRVRILKRRGLPFILTRLWRRTAFVWGACLFLSSLCVLGSTIWFVEIRGNELVTRATILEAARELGLAPGTYRKIVPANQLGRDLVIKLPQLSWAGVQLKGSCAVIEVVEKKIVVPDIRPVGNILAAKDGVIKKIVATKGKAMVKVGDTVKKGQILISGAFTVDEETETRYVPAEGIIEAIVWYQGTAVSKMQRPRLYPTGRQSSSQTLLLSDKVLTIYGPAKSPYALYEEEVEDCPLIWEELGLGARRQRHIYWEMIEDMEEISLQEARSEATEKATKQALELLPEGVLPLYLYHSEKLLPDGNTVQVKATLEAMEAIGKFEALASE